MKNPATIQEPGWLYRSFRRGYQSVVVEASFSQKNRVPVYEPN